MYSLSACGAIQIFVSSLMSTGKFDVIYCTRARESMKSDPEAVRPQNVTRCSHKLECIVATNPDWSVLSTTITWHFHFHLVNVCNLHFMYEYGTQRDNRFTCYPHCYITCHPTVLNVKGRCVLDARPHICNAGLFKSVKKSSATTKHIYNESANISKYCNVVFTPMIAGISHKRWQRLGVRVWGHALAFVTNEITWRRAYVSLLGPLLWEKWCHFSPKSTQLCYDPR